MLLIDGKMAIDFQFLIGGGILIVYFEDDEFKFKIV